MVSFNWEKEVETQWDSRAHFWNERSRNMWDSGSRKNIIPFIEKHLEKGSTILDIGCGDGYGSYQLHQEGYEVVGTDISGEMIRRAQERVPNKEIKFSQGNITNLPFADHSCNGMMIINVLEWTEYPAQAINELYRVVEQDGFVCVGILGPTAGPRANSYPRLTGEKTICNTMMPWEFMRLATDKHFAYVDGYGVYKDGVKEKHHQGLPLELQQALAFMWVFMLRKVEVPHG